MSRNRLDRIALPILVLALPPLAASARPVAEHRLLANGFKVVTLPGAATQGLQATLFIRAGWSQDTAGTSGLAELVTASIPGGSQKLSGPDLRQRLEEMGGRIQSHIARDYAAYSLALVKPESLPQGLELLADLVQHPGFSPQVLETAARNLTEQLMELRSNPTNQIQRYLPAIVEGGATALPDAWSLRMPQVARLNEFHRLYYRPDTAVLALAGALTEDSIAAVEHAFAGWERPAASALTTPAASRAAGKGIALLEAPVESTPLAFVLPAGRGETTPPERYFIAELLADSVGRRGAAGYPFPASGLEGVFIGQPADAAAALRSILVALSELARTPPAPERLTEILSRLELRVATDLRDPAFAAFWSGLSEFHGTDGGILQTLARVSPMRVQAAASHLLETKNWRALVIGPPSLRRALAAIAPLESLEPGSPPDPEARKRSERGRRILAAAVAAQGGADRLLQIESLEERGLGTYFGFGTVVDIKWRLLATPPGRVLMDSSMYRHNRFITNRFVDGQTWTDRSKIGTSPAPIVRGLLMQREVFHRPAFALIRPFEFGDARWVAEGSGPDGSPHDVIEVLDPAAGVARYWIRRRDAALTRLSFSLAPLDDASSEEHVFDDFAFFKGVRLPWSDTAAAGGRPFYEICYTLIDFPDDIDPDLYARPLRAPFSAADVELSPASDSE